MRLCSIDGCDNVHKARGWCNRHWLRWARFGDPLAGAPRPTLEDRFLAKVALVDGHWIWQGYISDEGYGRIMLTADGRRTAAYTHRVAYELFVGPIPDGLQIDHVCRVRACCFPEHLEPVTPLENIRRGLGGPKSHCGRGHEFTPDNTYVSREGKRACRTCHREIERVAKRIRRAAARAVAA